MMTFTAVYLHTIDPYAVKLWDGGPIRWYGLSYLLGFLVAYYLIRRVAYVGRSPIKLVAVGDFLVSIAIGVVVGGRLGYVLFYQPQMLWTLSARTTKKNRLESPPYQHCTGAHQHNRGVLDPCKKLPSPKRPASLASPLSPSSAD